MLALVNREIFLTRLNSRAKLGLHEVIFESELAIIGFLLIGQFLNKVCLYFTLSHRLIGAIFEIVSMSF